MVVGAGQEYLRSIGQNNGKHRLETLLSLRETSILL